MASAEALTSMAAGRGALICLEGIDRAGKSRVLDAHLVDAKTPLDDHATHLLFSANRWEKAPALRQARALGSVLHARPRSVAGTLLEGVSVVLDRYAHSGVAFSVAKGLPLDWCLGADRGLPAPDLFVYLQLDPDVAARRGDYGKERYERLEFQREVANAYGRLRHASWKTVNADQPPEAVWNAVVPLALEAAAACRQGAKIKTLWDT
eukprot:jgi/Chlat1/1466/Chrsp12S02068